VKKLILSKLMKKLTLSAITLSIASNLLAQGTVIFNNRTLGTSHVYAPGDGLRIVGNALNDTPPGSTDYRGGVVIGANGTGGQYGAATTLAMLLGAPGSNASESSLLPMIGNASSFRTGTAAGAVANSTATFNNIPPDAPVATFEMVAWDNSSGLYPTWTQASVAWVNDLIAAGRSPLFVLQNIGGSINTPPPLFPGLQSFNLYFTPEPTTATLLGLAAVLLISRRRK
jgi:hypothetical protein